MPSKRRQGRKSSAKNNAKQGDKAQKPGDKAQKPDDKAPKPDDNKAPKPDENKAQKPDENKAQKPDDNKAPKPGNTAQKVGDILEEATEEQSPKVSFRDMTEAILSVAGTDAPPVQVFPKLNEVMENLMCLQKPFSLVAAASSDVSVRLEACEKLLEAMSERSVDCSGVAIGNFRCKGLGLLAKRHFKKHEVILRIPRHEIMTAEDAKQSEIRHFLMLDPVCIAMPPLALALFLLHERFKGPDSKWAAYIAALPQTFTGCLYMSVTEFDLLKGSPLQEKIALDYRRMCRQYAIFSLEFERWKEAENVLFRHRFTWEDFRWAVTAVLSRNNPIPKDQHSSAIGLVPVWDMGNHEFGEMTTDYDLDARCLVFHAMRDFAKGEQIVFHYGNRPNGDLFMYAGFAVEDNPYDRFPLKLGISANDPLYEKRTNLLKKFDLENPENFFLARNDALPKQVIAFARIFVMKEEYLDEVALWSPDQLFQPLRAPESPPSLVHIDEEAASFLKQRFQLLMSVIKQQKPAPPTEGGAEVFKLIMEHSLLLNEALEVLNS